MSETDQFTRRTAQTVIVEAINGREIRFDGGMCFAGAPADALAQLVPGQWYVLETRRGSEVTGMATIDPTALGEIVVSEWLWHKSDADLDRERAEFTARLAAERETELEANRADWTAREAALPEPLRRRLDRFRTSGGHRFETSGWGYELIVCKLAVLYAASEQTESAEVTAFAHAEGTTGNQHDCAKALSRLLTGIPADEDTIVNTPAATSPLTGDVDYSRSA